MPSERTVESSKEMSHVCGCDGIQERERAQVTGGRKIIKNRSSNEKSSELRKYEVVARG